MKIIKYELLKIVTNKLFIFIFLVLWFINFIFLNYHNYLVPENDISHKAYKLLVSDLKGKNNLDKGIFINDLYQRAKAINIIYNIQNYRKSDNPLMREYADALRDENKEIYNMYYEESKNPIWKYTGNSDTELVFLEIIKTEYDIVNNYHKSLNNILDESKTIENVSIFNSNDNVSLKSISKTSDVYRSMLNTEVNYEVGKTVEKITSLNITDFFVLIIIFIFSMILTLEEKEKNLLIIIKSTKNGQFTTIVSKIVALFISTCLICILFYGMNFLYYYITLGCGDFFATVQSLSMFTLSTIKVNILEYLLMFFMSKCLYIFLLSLLIFYLSIKFNSISEVLLILFIIILINFIVYKGVDVTSNINLFHSFNLIGLINTNEIFRIYDNLRFYNMIVSKTSILLFLQVVLIFIFIILSIFKYLKNMNNDLRVNKIILKLKEFKLFKNIRFNSVFSFEVYKLLFVNKSLMIIIIFILFVSYNFKNQNFNLSYNEDFYKNYMDVLSGHLDKEKEEIIENTLNEYDKASKQLSEIQEKVKSGELSNIEGMIVSQPYEDVLATRSIFEKIEYKYNYIKENPNASFVYDTGYNKLFRVYKSVDFYDIYLIIFTVISILALFIMEYRTGVIQILNTAKNGRVKTANKKVLVTVIFCTFLFIISTVTEVIGIYKMYGLPNMDMSVISLEVFSNLPSNMSILTYLIVFYIVRYISYILIILLVEYISLKFKNMIFAFIVSIFILLIPFVMNIINNFQVNLFPFFNISLVRYNLAYFILVPIIVIINVFLYNSVVKKLE